MNVLKTRCYFQAVAFAQGDSLFWHCRHFYRSTLTSFKFPANFLAGDARFSFPYKIRLRHVAGATDSIKAFACLLVSTRGAVC